eukprot:391965_1
MIRISWNKKYVSRTKKTETYGHFSSNNNDFDSRNTSKFNTLQTMSDWWSVLAFGFIRQHEKRMILSNPIPIGIISMVERYCKPNYLFKSAKDELYLSEDKHIATLKGEMNVTLNEYFEPNEYHKICLKIIKMGVCELLIGIACTKWDELGSYDDWNAGDNGSCIIRSDGFYLATKEFTTPIGNDIGCGEYLKSFAEFWDEGHEIIIEMNGKEKQIKIWNCTINGAPFILNYKLDLSITLMISSGWTDSSSIQTIQIVSNKCL